MMLLVGEGDGKGEKTLGPASHGAREGFTGEGFKDSSEGSFGRGTNRGRRFFQGETG